LIQIGKKDIYWNYAATFLKIASFGILLPFILRMMPSEMVGIWSVFITITAFSALLDFGFGSSFTRNISYIFSGVKNLKTTGIDTAINDNQNIDYGLLKGVITSMRWLYKMMAATLLLLLLTVGTYYIYSLLQNYKGDHFEVYIAWGLLCLITTYDLFTRYFDSLLQGKGLIKKSKQIIIIGQTTYLIIASIFLMAGFGLIAIVSAQLTSVIIVRWMSYHAFFTPEIKQKLVHVTSRSKNEILKAVYPNAIKIGFTGIGNFLVQRSAIIIGSLYLTLEEIASFGITIQLIAVIAGLAAIYTVTYQPKIAQLRVSQNNTAIKKLYLKGQIVLLMTYIAGGTGLLILGGYILNLIGSQTQLMPPLYIFVLIIVSFL
jgi:O-antigen/teichoic acid export membrane protein